MSEEMEPYIEEALTRMYEEAEPSLDFKEVLENPSEQDYDWYEQHYLSSERQGEIVDNVKEKYSLNDAESRHLSMTAILDYGPTSNPDLVESVDAPSDER